jgi:hypothetical protein
MPCSTRIRLVAWTWRSASWAAARAGRTVSWFLRADRGVMRAPAVCALGPLVPASTNRVTPGTRVSSSTRPAWRAWVRSQREPGRVCPQNGSRPAGSVRTSALTVWRGPHRRRTDADRIDRPPGGAPTPRWNWAGRPAGWRPGGRPHRPGCAAGLRPRRCSRARSAAGGPPRWPGDRRPGDPESAGQHVLGDPVAPHSIRLSRSRGWRKPSGAVVVSWPNRWGDPFRVGATYMWLAGEQDLTWRVPTSREPGTTTAASASSAARTRRPAVAWFRRWAAGDYAAEAQCVLRGHDLARWSPSTSPATPTSCSSWPTDDRRRLQAPGSTCGGPSTSALPAGRRTSTAPTTASAASNAHTVGGYAAVGRRAKPRSVGPCAPPTSEHRRRLTQNGFRASFLPEEDKARHLAAVAASQP